MEGNVKQCRLIISESARYKQITTELQWPEQFWNDENMFKTGVVRANECKSQCQAKRHNRDIFSIFLNVKVLCVFSLKSSHRGDSKEYTQYNIFNIRKNTTLNYFKFAYGILFQGIQGGVRNICGKRAISVQAIEGLLYIY